MAENKTIPTAASVDAFIEGLGEERQREDSCALVALMQRITGEPPIMWGPAIIGFGTYHYVYDSGREGDMFLAGFSPRKTSHAIYGIGGFDQRQSQLDRLGKHKVSGSCLHVKKLADIDLAVLEEMIQGAVQKHRS